MRWVVRGVSRCRWDRVCAGGAVGVALFSSLPVRGTIELRMNRLLIYY